MGCVGGAKRSPQWGGHARVCAERSGAHKCGGKARERGLPAHEGSEAGRARPQRSANPGGQSVSAHGRAWAAGAREKRGSALRRKGSSRRAQGRKREPPPISEKRPNDPTDTYITRVERMPIEWAGRESVGRAGVHARAVHRRHGTR